MTEGASTRYRFAFHGDAGTFFGIWIVNLLLTILTLGIYHSWARTRVRRYLWENTEFAGERFVYHGTGGELFIGWLKALGLFVLLLVQMVVWVLAFGEEVGAMIGSLVFYLGFIAIVPFAIYGAARYRFSRSSYRGVRFSLRGSAGEFTKIFFRDALISMVTFGIYTPYFLHNMREYVVRHAHYGNRPFQYDGKASDIFLPYLLFGWLLVFPTLGITSFWARALLRNYSWSRTTFMGVRFQSTVDGAGLLWLTFSNLLLVIFTIGLATPWAEIRSHRYLTGHLAAFGTIDFESIRQQILDASATADGLTELIDGDGFDIGIGL